MSPRHFSKLIQKDPIAFEKGQDKVWNTFVSVTHSIGLSNFFSFTPDFQGKAPLTPQSGQFNQGEIPGDKE